MTNPLNQRINQRLQELGISAQAASLKATGSRDVIRAILSGATKSPRVETLEKIAAALETSPEWLMGKSKTASETAPAKITLPDLSDMPTDVPVKGTSADRLDDGIFLLDGGTVEFVRRPPALAGTRDVYAIYVEGSAMEPRHTAGDLLFIHPHRPARIDDVVIAQFQEDSAGPVRARLGYFKGREAGAVKLRTLNPDTTVEIGSNQVLAIHKVMTLNELFGV